MAYELASEDLGDAKQKPVKGAAPEKELKGRHFLRLLEEVILAATGIVLGHTPLRDIIATSGVSRNRRR